MNKKRYIAVFLIIVLFAALIVFQFLKPNVDDIQEGMPLSQVIDILGEEYIDAGSGFIIYRWDLKDGSYFYGWFGSDEPLSFYDPDKLILTGMKITQEKLGLMGETALED